MAGGRLGRDERARIEAGIAAGETNAEIALAIGRDRSTVWREVCRGGGREAYRAESAQRDAEAKARRPRENVLATDSELAAVVLDRLRRRWSPHAIAAWLRARGERRVCAETIYQAVYDGVVGPDAHELLVSGRKRRRRRCRAERAKRSTLGPIVNISVRCPAAAARYEAGHWEGDLIKGAGNRSGVVTLVERVSRYTLLGDLPGGCTADETLACLLELFGRVPRHLRKSLTWDQGTEMASWQDLRATLRLPVYFCDPHAPWQRPSNENTNRHLRRWLPKGTNLATYSQHDLNEIAHHFNTMPRRLHNWTSAAEQYTLLAGCNNR